MIDHLMSAHNPWGPAAVTFTVCWLIGALALTVTGSYRKAAMRTLARTRDELAISTLMEGLADCWGLINKTVAVGGVVTSVCVVVGAWGSRNWIVLGVLPLFWASVALWWRYCAAPARRIETSNPEDLIAEGQVSESE